MFGITGLTQKTIDDVKDIGGKITLHFKGEDLIAEINLGDENMNNQSKETFFRRGYIEAKAHSKIEIDRLKKENKQLKKKIDELKKFIKDLNGGNENDRKD